MVEPGAHGRLPGTQGGDEDDEEAGCLVPQAATAIDKLTIRESTEVHVGNKIVYNNTIVLPNNSGKIVFDVGGTTFKLFIDNPKIPRLSTTNAENKPEKVGMNNTEHFCGRGGIAAPLPGATLRKRAKTEKAPLETFFDTDIPREQEIAEGAVGSGNPISFPSSLPVSRVRNLPA
ncbi:hypothetical protein AAG570_011719 [Ranatra chinensis]|uniref:Uncharacterized protein n=1 Tax=Ranatra chinensis TaxID=642074 RepID=A0ABD0YGP0_9HEMI